MLLVGRPQSFLEPNPQPGKPPVLICPPVLILVMSSRAMPSRAILLNAISGKRNTSQDPSFPGCNSPLNTANHYASFLRSHLSQATPHTSRRAKRQFRNDLRKASCEDASSLHNSFCSLFSLAELSTAICKLSFFTASGPDQIAYPLLKHLPEPAQLLLLSLFQQVLVLSYFPLLLETYHYHPHLQTWKTHFLSFLLPLQFPHLLHLQAF